MTIRVLQMIGTLGIGGSQSFVMNLYRNIDRNNIQFDFIVDHPNLDYYVNEIESLGGKVYYFPTFTGSNIVQVIKVWNQFFKEHPEYKIMHSHVRSYASIYIPIAKKYGLKTIIHSHSLSNGSGIKAMIKNILQFPLRYEADYFFSCSLEAGKWLFGKKVCMTDKFKIVKNAIDVKSFIFSNDNRILIRNEYNLEDRFVIGFLARVTEAKNPFFVIDILKYLLKYDSSIILLFVGDGNLLDKVKSMAKNLNIENNVVFTGEKSDVGKLLSAMDYYVLPSKWEGLGISLIEAQASGIKCLCSEAIQDEAIITDLVQKCSIKLGAKKWAEIIYSNKNYIRDNKYDEIQKAGYDIKDSVLLISKFYFDLYNEVK